VTDYPKIDPDKAPKLPEGVTLPEGYERWYGGEPAPEGLKCLPYAQGKVWCLTSRKTGSEIILGYLEIHPCAAPIRECQKMTDAEHENTLKNYTGYVATLTRRIAKETAP